jgi:hypothetical protein
MPKTEIDYANTIIYKITCNDKQVTDVYVGHTTNIVQRKYAHKQSCINSKNINYNNRVYEVIRANGGWSNWSLEIINCYNCADQYAAKKKEQEYIDLLQATLNNNEPVATSNEEASGKKTPPHINEKTMFYCETCQIQCATNKALEDHNKTKRHLKNIDVVTNFTPKNAETFECAACYFKCSKQSDWDRHLSTDKHFGNTLGNTGNTENAPVNLTCEFCNKLYKSRKGLWGHNKVCNGTENVIIHNTLSSHMFPTSSNEIKMLTTLVLDMVKNNTDLQKQNNDIQKQNIELQKQVLDVCKNSNTNINSHNNSNNKTFNLQFFLNEQCKDAMNLSDFMNSFELGLEDLESIGELGYVEGITKIMVDRLNAMDIYKRPVHCSDAKRETLYVKNEDRWEKEARNNPKLRYAIKTASFQSMKLTVLWSDTYPESKSSESRLNDKYMKLVFQSTGGTGEIADSEDKIIRRILKEIVIAK